jgi:hypothetical protein
MAQMRHHVVSFLDILGYRRMVNHDASSQTQTFLPKLVSCLDQVRAAQVAEGLDVRNFSDSIIVSSPKLLADAPIPPTYSITMIETVSLLQRLFLVNGILIRGGISLGRHFSDDRVIFSEALIQAYELESKAAIYPRVLLSKDLVDWTLNHPQASTEEKTSFARMVLKDKDGRVFVQYVPDGWVEDHRRHALNYIGSTDASKETILEKIQWLAEFHNFRAQKSGRPDLAISPIPLSFASVRIPD